MSAPMVSHRLPMDGAGKYDHGAAFGQQTGQGRFAASLGACPTNASPPRRAEPMNPPDILGDDIIVAASTSLCTISKRPLPHFRLGNQIAARRSTLPAWIDAEDGSRLG